MWNPLFAVACTAALAVQAARAQEAAPRGTEAVPQGRLEPVRTPDYTFGWWPNGFRKEDGDRSPDVFCIETGYYAFLLNLLDFSDARFARIQGPGYLQAARPAAVDLSGLPRAGLRLEIERGGRVYRAVSCLGGRRRDRRHTVLLESARFVQHYRFPGVEFRDAAGTVLEADGTLELFAWPSFLSFHLSVAPDDFCEDGPCPGLAGMGLAVTSRPAGIPHEPALDPQDFTLEIWVKVPRKFAHANRRHWLVGKNKNEWADGNFGLLLDRRNVVATLNIGGGRENVWSLERKRAVTPGRWHHLAMSYDGRFLRLYVDGRPAGSVFAGKPRVPGRGKLTIGGRPDGHGEPVHAVFDELRIWSRALPAEVIRAHAEHPARLEGRGLSRRVDFDELPKSSRAAAEPHLDGARLRIVFGGRRVETPAHVKWPFGVERDVVLGFACGPEKPAGAPVVLRARQRSGLLYRTRHDEKSGAYVVDVPRFERDWRPGYTDIRDYDEVALEVRNEGKEFRYVPVLFDVKRPANLTGLTPVLCDADGRPTGIPVQISKNWHFGGYAKLYTLLPSGPGETHYRLRIAYGFWGTLPAASHAQLSLYGYGGNGRWEQLAIGCWGETMCLDADNSLTTHMITDARMLFTRKGKTGRKWHWSDGGWGGDWLGLKREGGGKLFPVSLKTAYLACGPCLTDVRYGGFYGKKRDMRFEARVATLRTDDYNRVFQSFRYEFAGSFETDGAYFFKMGPNAALLTPRIAYGNRTGLIAEHEVPGTLRRGDRFKKSISLAGEAPWWVAFPGSILSRTRNWGTGSRALIVRGFKAVFSGKTYTRPVLSFPVQAADRTRGLVGCDLELVAPEGVAHFKPGDTVELDVEWITVPRVADDYYGPNRAFLEHLKQNPRSWKTVFREAARNHLDVRVKGGTLVNRYPIVIVVRAEEVEVLIRGGAGAVPIRFEGVESPAKCSLFRVRGGLRVRFDPSVHGNDFRQVDYDPGTASYKLTYNLPLDGLEESTWVLSRE